MTELGKFDNQLDASKVKCRSNFLDATSGFRPRILHFDVIRIGLPTESLGNILLALDRSRLTKGPFPRRQFWPIEIEKTVSILIPAIDLRIFIAHLKVS